MFWAALIKNLIFVSSYGGQVLLFDHQKACLPLDELKEKSNYFIDSCNI